MAKFKNLLYGLIAALLLTLILLGYMWWQSRSALHVETRSSILLERIRKVAKLTTVEGQFSEIYEKTSFKYFDISPFQKKVLVRVKATVAAGFDFDHLSLEIDSLHKVIYINSLPDPQILSIDHDLDYYDISEGLFTSFTVQDYNQIQVEAKALIKQKASESQLLSEAGVQGQEFLEMVRLIAQSAGWELKVRSRPLLKQ
ncbi:MAG: DUF4230 domain-containing protein [Saprospiraceae bacterium]|jgi:hypothetical protein|nr:DUF4230 domain-containing protein [Saprospiraceae bacterium]MBK6816551.1 DUF4230 domain-containing protein [Saprospiraceae bacterium]MBK8514551.1 DUF4230 domain-containing protein [Saprospiraceae bacterium]MBK8777142.1 DUF4230 domain-containing protein [Saprospiraceae bacterium]MBK9679905.1 DUF4230 domain-containing protein [Saprospiraceae bacterium]